jgi:hypothetical protein
MVSSPAWAEGTPEDEARLAFTGARLEALRDCVVNQAAADCIGAHSTECIAAFAQSHAGRGNCVSEEKMLWGIVHSEILIRKLEQARATDQSEILLGMLSGGGRVPLMMQSEVSWRAHARTHCNLEMRHWGAGTIGVTQRPYCDIRMIAERIDFLRNLQL